MLKIMKGNKIVGAVEEWSDRDKKFHPDLIAVQDNEHQISDYTMVEGEYLLNDDPAAIEYEKNRIRELRNSYLVRFVDPVVSNPLRWADMTEEEKQQYADYRRYLLDFTTQEDWWKNTPETFEEWSK